MPKVSVLNIKGEKIQDLNLNDNCWNIKPNDKVLYNAIILAKASLRQGTQSTKTRAEVRGGGRKPRPQKGSNRSRQGSIRSPQWVGGGVVFAPKPRSYSQKMNRKERRLAMKSALTYKHIDEKLVIIDDLKLTIPKTKEMLNIMDNLKVTNKVLFVAVDIDDNTLLASHNLELVYVTEPDKVSLLDIINSDYLVMTIDATKKLEEVLLQ